MTSLAPTTPIRTGCWDPRTWTTPAPITTFDPTNPSGCWDPRGWTQPAAEQPVAPIDRNCWVPRNSDGTIVQLPTADAADQAVASAALVA